MRGSVLVILSVLLASCGGGGGGGSGSAAPTLMSITVTPTTSSVANGLTQQFTATATLSDSSTKDITSGVIWSSSGTSTLSIDASGLAHAQAVGSVNITAASGAISGTTTVNVIPPVLQSVAINPSAPATSVGRPTSIFALGTYSDKSQKDVTTTAHWTSSAPSIATVDAATGVVTGVVFGHTTITATVGSVTASATLTVGSRDWHLGTADPAPLNRPTATLLQTGKVLVVGGGGGTLSNIPDTHVQLYQPGDSGSDHWSAAASLSAPRGEHSATLLSNGVVLVAGGVKDSPAAVATGELYDPATDKWSAAGSLITARQHHSATLLPNGKVLAVGGILASGQIAITTAELYDPATNSWAAAASPVDGRFLHTATLLLNGKVLVAGGFVPSGGLFGPPARSLATAELYDPATNTWSPAGSLASGRDSHTATLLADGRVLVASGYRSGTTTTTAEVYDPTTNQWSAAGNLQVARTTHTATLLSDGTVLVVGGYVGGSTMSAESYDPVANTWSAAPELKKPRMWHNAVHLANGDVLILGGVDSQTGGVRIVNPESYW